METINHLPVFFSTYVLAAGGHGPSTLRILGAAMNRDRTARGTRSECSASPPLAPPGRPGSACRGR
jgi:hypothetical protein